MSLAASNPTSTHNKWIIVKDPNGVDQWFLDLQTTSGIFYNNSQGELEATSGVKLYQLNKTTDTYVFTLSMAVGDGSIIGQNYTPLDSSGEKIYSDSSQTNVIWEKSTSGTSPEPDPGDDTNTNPIGGLNMFASLTTSAITTEATSWANHFDSLLLVVVGVGVGFAAVRFVKSLFF